MGQRDYYCGRPYSGNCGLLCSLCDEKNHGAAFRSALSENGPEQWGVLSDPPGIHYLFNTTRYWRLVASPVWDGRVPF